MEEKKEKFKFLKNISERFKTIDEKQKKFIIIMAIIVVAIVIISIVTSIIFALSTNDAGKVAGNLNNEGFAIEKGNKAYISNTLINSGEKSSQNGLYEISNKNTSKLVTKDEYVKSINIYKGYLYYLAINKAENGNYIRQVVKIKPNGENKQILVDNIETTTIANNSLNVSDGWVYYTNSDNKLEKVKKNGEKRQQVSDEEIAKFQISGKYIYYTTKDDDFKRMKKDGSNIEKFENGIDSFQIISDDVYYISKANGHLMKLNLKDNTDTEIINKKIKTFNIYGKTIYYAVNENNEHAIYKIKINGKKNQKIVDLESANVFICVIGNWIYYTDKVEDSPYYYCIYRIKTNGEKKEAVTI